MPSQAEGGTTRHPRWRNVAVSAFFSFHLVAIAWWNFGKGGLPPAAPGQDRGVVDEVFSEAIPSVVDAVDPGHHVQDLLSAYVRLSTTWQLWWMFAPEAPRVHGAGVMYGITGYGRDGRPQLDPEPLWGGESRELTQHLIEISKPPCGVASPPDDPRSRFFIRSYAAHQLERANAGRDAPYVGVHYVCDLYDLPEPGSSTMRPAGTWVLWSTPSPAAGGPR